MYRHQPRIPQSLIHTLRQRWSLGAPFSAREAIAPDLRPVLSRQTPRDPQGWPDIHPQPVPEFTEAMVPPERPLRGLARALFFAFLGLGKGLGQPVPDISPDATITGAAGLTLTYDAFGHLFPNLSHERQPRR